MELMKSITMFTSYGNLQSKLERTRIFFMKFTYIYVVVDPFNGWKPYNILTTRCLVSG